MVGLPFRVPTAVFVASPGSFLEDNDRFEEHTLLNICNKMYEWERDPLWGLYDVAQSPSETLDKGTGDCVDWSRLAASYLYYETDRPIQLVVMFQADVPAVGHMVVDDGERIWSNGSLSRLSVAEWMDVNEYKWSFRRTVRQS